MHCARTWDHLTLESLVPASFLKGPWRTHETECARKRQLQQLQETEPLVGRWKRAREQRDRAERAREEARRLQERAEALEDRAEQLEAEAEAAETEAEELEGPIPEDQAPGVGMAQAAPCARPECIGRILPDSTCSQCAHVTCLMCMSYVGPPGTSSEHQCTREALETARLIRENSRPCPGCGTRVEKVRDGGCDQMWCTQCRTAFSWRTGIRVVRGRIHNPHYFEHLRERGGAVPRAPGDLPCGGLCTLGELNQAMAQIPSKNRDAVEKMRRIHHVLDGAILDHELPDADLRRQGQLGREGMLDQATELRVRYMLGLCSDEGLGAQALEIEEESQLWQGVYNALSLYAHLASEAIRSVVRAPSRESLAGAHLTLAWAGETCNMSLCELHLLWRKRVPLLGRTLDAPRDFPEEGARRRLSRVHPKSYPGLLAFVQSRRPHAPETE